MPYGSPLRQRDGRSPSVHGRAPTCQPRAPHEQLTCVRAQVRTAPPRALALSREEAQHARLRRARAPPRWLESAHALWKPTAPAGRPSPSVHGRAPTCQPRAPHEQLTCVRAQVRTAPPRALALSREEAQHARLRRARAPPRWLESAHTLWKPTAPAGRPLSLGARPCSGVQAACSTRAADLRACASQNCATARARSLSGGGAARALATCARPAALVGVGPYPMEAHCASGTAALPRCTAVLRRASRGLHTSS